MSCGLYIFSLYLHCKLLIVRPWYLLQVNARISTRAYMLTKSLRNLLFTQNLRARKIISTHEFHVLDSRYLDKVVVLFTFTN